jgi:hypothetical protein
MEQRNARITETERIPLDGLLLGYGAMLPLLAAAAMAWTLESHAGAARVAAIGWGAAIALFLAGVRRGLSFRTPGGVRAGQIAMMVWLFCAGLAAPFLPREPALWLLATVYLSLAILDPLAARAWHVPLYFRRLRPWQMGLAAASLAATALA